MVVWTRPWSNERGSLPTDSFPVAVCVRIVSIAHTFRVCACFPSPIETLGENVMLALLTLLTVGARFSLSQLIVIGSWRGVHRLERGPKCLRNPSALACQELVSPLSLLLLRRPKAETRPLVLIDELNSGLFERRPDRTNVET